MADIKPFRISVPDAQIADLKDRLSRARLPDELVGGAAWDLGSPLADVRRLARYWGEAFDWRAAEARLNDGFPQFTTPIQADGFEPLEIHFVHQRSAVPGAIPLLYVHGWPGSFYEGTKIIGPLAQVGVHSLGGGGGGHVPAFHVVAPSLPNYGFSEGSRRRGFAIDQYAEVFNKLMLRLGYGQYATQGGDWGWAITRALSLRYPQHARAQHLNMDMGKPPSLLRHPRLAVAGMLRPRTERELAGLARTRWFRERGMGYNVLQSTRPQTLGYALADSPVALLAWIYEKLHDWTDSYPWTDDEICTWISIYWFSTAGPAASVRIYYEFKESHARRKKGGAEARNLDLSRWQNVKVGLAHFPKDLGVLPSAWTRTVGDVVYEKHHPDGGHFAAWERPEAIVGDLREMFGKNGGARGVVRTSKL